MRHKQTPYEQHKILLERSLTRSEDPLSSTSGLPPSITQSHKVREKIANDAQRMATEIPTPTRQAEQIQRDLLLCVQEAEARQKKSETALLLSVQEAEARQKQSEAALLLSFQESEKALLLSAQETEARQKQSETALRNVLKELFENSCRVRGRQLRSAAKGQSRTALEARKEIVAGDNEVHGNNLYKDTWWVAVKGGSKEGLEWFYGIEVGAAKVLLMAATVTYLVPNQNLVRTTKVKLPGKLTVQNGIIVDSNETTNMLF